MFGFPRTLPESSITFETFEFPDQYYSAFSSFQYQLVNMTPLCLVFLDLNKWSEISISTYTSSKCSIGRGIRMKCFIKLLPIFSVHSSVYRSQFVQLAQIKIRINQLIIWIWQFADLIELYMKSAPRLLTRRCNIFPHLRRISLVSATVSANLSCFENDSVFTTDHPFRACVTTSALLLVCTIRFPSWLLWQYQSRYSNFTCESVIRDNSKRFVKWIFVAAKWSSSLEATRQICLYKLPTSAFVHCFCNVICTRRLTWSPTGIGL